MSSPTDTGPAAGGSSAAASLPRDWKAALAGLVSSRIALIRLESQEVVGSIVKRLICAAIMAVCAFFTWCLILAGAVGLIASATGWSWGWVALALAALHLVVAVICAIIAKTGGAPAFPVTKAEFQKDRAWLQTFQKKNKSSD